LAQWQKPEGGNQVIKIITCLAVLLGFQPYTFGQEQTETLGLVWTGSTENPTYQALANKEMGIKVRAGGDAHVNEVQIRAATNMNFVEVRHLRSNEWITMKIPRIVSLGSVDANRLVRGVLQFSNCDQVKTILDLNNSTPKTEMYFNSKPIGPVKEDGRFYYESLGVCRGSSIELIGTLPACKDFMDAFNAANNPQTYKGNAVPDCSKKTASK
jgi:hypothetical protein